MNTQDETIKTKSDKANEIVRNCNSNLAVVRKKQNTVIENFNRAIDSQKIEKVKKEIELL